MYIKLEFHIIIKHRICLVTTLRTKLRARSHATTNVTVLLVVVCEN